MANGIERQYIGARYVPVFFNNPDGSWDWAQGFQYEPLTLVKYGENTYTSKMLVPSTVGAPNLNPEYWAQTGNYNGTITSIQQDINTINNGIGSSRVELSKRVFVCIGDSYGEEKISKLLKWPYWCKTALGLSNNQWINAIDSGKGFISKGGSFMEEITKPQVLNRAEDITDILVIGGLPDSGPDLDLSTLSSKMGEFITYCKNTFPKATVYLGYVGSVLSNAIELKGRTIYDLLNTQQIYELTGNALGYTIIPNLKKAWTFGTDYYFEDGVHPTYNQWESGAGLIGLAIANFIKGYEFKAWNNVGHSSSLNCNYIYEKDNVMLFSKNNPYISWNINKVIGTSFTEVLDIDFTTFLQNFSIMLPCLASYNSGVNVKYINCIIQFNGIKVSIRILPPDEITDPIDILYLPTITIPRWLIS